MRGFKDVLYPKLKLVPDRLERAAIAHEAAAYLGLDAGLVLQEVRKAPVEKAAAAPSGSTNPSLPANERILLNAILTSPEAALSVVPQLRERGLEGLTGQAIFEAVLAAAGDRAPALDEVEARLDERNRAVLHRIVFADQIDDGMTEIERAQTCLAAIGDVDMEGRRTEIRRKIKEAERNGDLAELRKWTRELDRTRS
jgi:hypothetical protein